jgi:hypothetical protein
MVKSADPPTPPTPPSHPPATAMPRRPDQTRGKTTPPPTPIPTVLSSHLLPPGSRGRRGRTCPLPPPGGVGPWRAGSAPATFPRGRARAPCCQLPSLLPARRSLIELPFPCSVSRTLTPSCSRIFLSLLGHPPSPLPPPPALEGRASGVRRP